MRMNAASDAGDELKREGIDILEHLPEDLPAAVLRTPVAPSDSGPIDINIAGILVHRRSVTTGGICDIRTPYPNHVASARGNEEFVNVSISGNV